MNKLLYTEAKKNYEQTVVHGGINELWLALSCALENIVCCYHVITTLGRTVTKLSPILWALMAVRIKSAPLIVDGLSCCSSDTYFGSDPA